MNLPKVKMLQVSKCLIGLAVMMLQSCDVADNRRDMLCGNWESVEGKPDVLIYKEGEAYKVTVFRRSGLRRKLKPETYLLQEENGNLFMNTGFRIDVSYNEATDVLTFSPNGDYVRVKPQPGHPTEESKLNLTKALSDKLQAKYDYLFRTKILDFYKGEIIE